MTGKEMRPRTTKPDWEDLVDRTPAEPVPAPRPPRKNLQKDSKDRRMAAYMTHELRAPLTSIRSRFSAFAEILKTSPNSLTSSYSTAIAGKGIVSNPANNRLDSHFVCVFFIFGMTVI